jgi:D-alanyl-D-alanine carboxypeptidase
MMNATARRIGANDSHFANPHGLDAEGHFTTAYDMALICREALKYDAINTIIKTERYLMPWPNHDYPRLITNHNSLVLPYSGVLYEGADGIKTGFTRKAGRCLAASATRGDMRLIAIVLNDGNDWRDCSAMFDWGFKTFKPLPLAKKGEALRTILVSHGDSESVTAVCEGDVYWPTAAGEDSAQLVLKSPESLSAPIKQGDQVGTAELVWKGEVVNSFRLVAQNDVNLTGWRAIWRDVVNGWHRVWPFVFSRPGRAKSDD